MNIIIWGYGKMGKAVEKWAKKRNHTIGNIIDIDNVDNISLQDLQKADVVIEFTQPKSAPENYKKCFAAGIPVVSGTTGWLDKKEEIEKYCKEKNATFFYTSNFSLGVNILFEVNKFLAKLMNNISQYQAEIEEIHHIHKKDKPSGTAITIAEQIMNNHALYTNWQLAETTIKQKDILPIKSIREEETIGTHTITYKSDIDEISLQHKAYSRDGFAQGAIIAAEFVKDKKGCFSMEDLLRDFQK